MKAALLALLLFPVILLAEDKGEPLYRYQAGLVRVVDGDTVDFNVDLGFGVWLHEKRFRLLGIDAPEMRLAERPAGAKSKAWLHDRLSNAETIVIQSFDAKKVGRDSFGRWLVVIYADGVNVCEEMLKLGLAEPWRE